MRENLAEHYDRRGVLGELEERPVEFALEEELRQQILRGPAETSATEHLSKTRSGPDPGATKDRDHEIDSLPDIDSPVAGGGHTQGTPPHHEMIVSISFHAQPS